MDFLTSLHVDSAAIDSLKITLHTWTKIQLADTAQSLTTLGNYRMIHTQDAISTCSYTRIGIILACSLHLHILLGFFQSFLLGNFSLLLRDNLL